MAHLFGEGATEKYHDRYVFRSESRVVSESDGNILIKAYDAEQARSVTLRIYNLEGLDADARELATTMWQSELRILTRLMPEQWRRPGLVEFFDGDEDPPTNSLYVAWEDNHKATLAEALSDSRLLSTELQEVPRKVELLVMLCEALFDLHAHGIIHREITPAAICLWDSAPLRAALTGFGMSIFVNNYLWAPAPDSFAPNVTLSKQLAYSAPERFAYLTNSYLDAGGLMVEPGEDYRQDIFGLGVSVVEWFTRPLDPNPERHFLPQGGGYDQYAHLEWLQDAVQGRIEREPLSNHKEAERALKQLLLDMTEFSPDSRISTAGELVYRVHEVRDLFRQVEYRMLVDQPFAISFYPDETAKYLDRTEPREAARAEMRSDTRDGQLRMELENDLAGQIRLGFLPANHPYAKDAYGIARWYLQGKHRVYLLERFRTAHGRECPWLAYLTHIVIGHQGMDEMINVPIGAVQAFPNSAVRPIANNGTDPRKWGRWDDLTAIIESKAKVDRVPKPNPDSLIALASFAQSLELREAERDTETYAMRVSSDLPIVSSGVVPVDDSKTAQINAILGEHMVVLNYDTTEDAVYVGSNPNIMRFSETNQRRQAFGDWAHSIADRGVGRFELVAFDGQRPRKGALHPVGLLESVDPDTETVILRFPPNAPPRASKVLIRRQESDSTLVPQRDALERLSGDSYRLGLLAHPDDIHHHLPDRPQKWLTKLGSGETPDQNKIDVVSACFAAYPAFFIQGPPGTGKSTTATEIIAQILAQNRASRILVASQANDALDTLLDSVLQKLPNKSAITILRIPPYRFKSRSHIAEKHPLAAVDSFSRGSRVKIRQFIAHFDAGVNESTHDEALQQPDRSEKLQSLADSWVKLLDARHSDIEQLLLRSANLVFATCIGTDRLRRHDLDNFDWVIVEEAGRANATELLLPLLRGHRWLLIGDQKQLRSYKADVIEVAFEHGVTDQLARSQLQPGIQTGTFNPAGSTRYLDLFAHLYARAARDQAAALTECYRMHPALVTMVDRLFYRESGSPILRAAKARADRTHNYSALDSSGADWLKDRVLLWVDTNPSELRREDVMPKWDPSHQNAYEISVISSIVSMLRNQDTASNIMLLSFYAAQHTLLQDVASAHDNVEALTVMSCQGKESDVVILSLTRSNQAERPRAALGSLLKPQDLNVAVSRAKRLLIIVGDAGHVGAFGPEAQKLWELLDMINNWGVDDEADHVARLPVTTLALPMVAPVVAIDRGVLGAFCDREEEDPDEEVLIDPSPRIVDAMNDKIAESGDWDSK